MGAGQLVSQCIPFTSSACLTIIVCGCSLEGLPFPNEEFDFVCVGYSSVIVVVLMGKIMKTYQTPSAWDS